MILVIIRGLYFKYSIFCKSRLSELIRELTSKIKRVNVFKSFFLSLNFGVPNQERPLEDIKNSSLNSVIDL